MRTDSSKRVKKTLGEAVLQDEVGRAQRKRGGGKVRKSNVGM